MSLEDEVRGIATRLLSGVKASGSTNLLAKCPFHRGKDGGMERHPSFSLSLTKGVYFCFACHEAGTLGKLIQQLDTGSPLHLYEPLLARLRVEGAAAQKANAHNPLNPKALQLLDEPIQEKVLGVFDACPVDLVDVDLFDESTLRYFGVGYDEVHGRITFPIRDLAGNLMGISGRTVLGDMPRYKIYDHEYTKFDFPARTQIQKSVFMWNADKVYLESCFQRIPLVVLVEGFKACMRVYAAGFRHVVALMGSSISDAQVWILERIGAPVCLMLDQNDAGQNGTKKVGNRLVKSLPVTVAAEYYAEQPSDLAEQEVVHSINAAQSFVLWTMQNN